MIIGRMMAHNWKYGQLALIRQYYTVIFKAARDIEELSGMGFKKLYYTRMVIIPTTLQA